jgi:hypothetical protein
MADLTPRETLAVQLFGYVLGFFPNDTGGFSSHLYGSA